MNEELKLNRPCVFCNNPARWRGEATKLDDWVECGNCQAHASVRQILKLEHALRLEQLINEKIKEKELQIEENRARIQPIQDEMSEDIMGIRHERLQEKISMYCQIINELESDVIRFQSLVEESEKD